MGRRVWQNFSLIYELSVYFYLVLLILVPCISFVHVVWPHGFFLGYLQVTSFHEKQLVSHLPMRHWSVPKINFVFVQHKHKM